MFNWWRSLIGQGRQETVASLRFKIQRFQSLLERNNRALELMAEAGESLGGDLLFDSQYLRRLAEELADCVENVVLDLNVITGNRYLRLMEAAEGVRRQVAAVLEGQPPLGEAPYVVGLEEIDRDLSEVVGEKMARLGEIHRRLGCRVPEGFVITARACQRVLDSIGASQKLAALARRTAVDPEEVERQLAQSILRARIPRDVRHAVNRALRKLGVRGPKEELLAVRSSALGEDDQRSFAGLHKTRLGVPVSEVLGAYLEVVASLFSAPAVAYRTSHGQPAEQWLMPVGCMRMVRARSAGVAYTLDPNAPEEDVLIVSAAVGLGRAVVEGKAAVDQFRLLRRPPHEVVERHIRRKEVMYAVRGGGGVQPVAVPPERRDRPAVSDEFLAQLAETALRIERYMGCAQDIEWAEDEQGRLVILQARPLRLAANVSGISRRAHAAAERHRVLLAGQGIVACRGIGYGKVVLVGEEERGSELPEDSVLVARVSSPHLAVLLPKAAAVITDTGATTGHLATMAREFRVPAIFDAQVATQVLAPGMEVTVDAEENVVYEGRVEELLRYQAVRRSGLEQWREFRLLRRMLKWIAPLHLRDPQAPDFLPQNCRTYHDIIRFAHEKAVQHLLEGHTMGRSRLSPYQKTVELAVPLDLSVIDLGGGVEAPPEESRCRIDQVSCLPLRALLEGLHAPGAWSTEPADLDLESFLSSALGRGALTGSADSTPPRNLALVSRHYLNMSLHLGYHFNQVDSYISQARNDNYIYFRFAGGMTELARRSRRARMVARILEKHDFLVETKGDFLVARLKKFDQPAMLERARMLGFLIGFTRQMDVRMRHEETIAQGVEEFMSALKNVAPAPGGDAHGQTD